MKFGGHTYDGELGKFNSSNGVAVDESGTIFVCDAYSHRIQVFQSDGVFLRAFGSRYGSRKEIKLNVPIALTFDFSGNLAILEESGCQVQIVDPFGNPKSKFGKEGRDDSCLRAPRAITTDNEGNFAIADASNCRIQIFSPHGVWLWNFGSEGKEPGKLWLPAGVGIDGTGNFIVSDAGNCRIQIFNPAGKHLRVLGDLVSRNLTPSMKSIMGLTVDKAGKVVLADGGNHQLQIFSTDTDQLLFTLGRGIGSRHHEMPYPADVAIDMQGRIIVSTHTNEIHIFAPW